MFLPCVAQTIAIPRRQLWPVSRIVRQNVQNSIQIYIWISGEIFVGVFILFFVKFIFVHEWSGFLQN